MESSNLPDNEELRRSALAAIAGLSQKFSRSKEKNIEYETDTNLNLSNSHNATTPPSTIVTTPNSVSTQSSINEILLFARKINASDVHLSVNTPIVVRQFCQLKALTKENLTTELMQQKINQDIPKHILNEFTEKKDAEFVHSIGTDRFRVTLLKHRWGWDLTARIIPNHIPSFEQSGMPPACKSLTKWAQGLILITGPAGCGKSTTLSILTEMINQSRYEHIITIEDPIEVVYKPAKCQITQREIKRHTNSQATALKAALREDPDIIIVSELRDFESIQLAVTAAETGHLVFGTMNTNNAVQTIFNLINSFPPDEQTTIASMVSESLRGVISQQLIPKLDGSGVVPAYEVLIHNSAVGNLIRENKIQQLSNVMTTGKSLGMVLLDAALIELVNKKIIDPQEAYYRATTPSSFKQYLPLGIKT